MSPFECKIVLVDPPLCWTETYYRLDAGSVQAMAALRQLAQVRRGLIGGTVAVARLRTARLDGVSDVYVDGLSPGPVGPPATHPTLAILCRLAAGVSLANRLYSTPLYLRGCPALFFERGGTTPAPGLTAAAGSLQVFFDTLVRLGFCLQVASRDLRQYPIQAIARYATANADCASDPLDPATLTPTDSRVVLVGDFAGLVADAALAGTQPPRVRVRGLTWWPRQVLKRGQLDGVHQVASLDPGAVVIPATVPATGTAQKKGTVRLAQFVYPPIAGGSIEGVTRRDTGGRSKMKTILPPTTQPALRIGVPFAVERGPSLTWEPVDYITIPYTTLHTAQDTAREIFMGYDVLPDGTVEPLGIYKILNRKDSWLITLSGTSKNQNSATYISEDITAGIGPDLPNKYMFRLQRVLPFVVPKGHRIVLAGHSLGAMIAQNVIPDLTLDGYECFGYLSIGGPLVRVGEDYPILNRLILKYDLANEFTPLGIVIAGGPAKYLWYTVLPDETLNNPYTAHNGYPTSTLMLDYTPFGTKFPAGLPADQTDIVLGQPTRFTVPWYYPPPPPP